MLQPTTIMQSEAEFLKIIELKAREERQILDTEIIPTWAKGIGEWLVVNPWRVMVPLASIVYLVIRLSYGQSFREIILGIFGGF